MREIQIRAGRIGATYETETGSCYRLEGLTSAGAEVREINSETGHISTHSFTISGSSIVVEKQGVLFSLGTPKIKGRHKRPMKPVSKQPLSDTGDKFKF